MAELIRQSTDLPCVTLVGMAGAGKSTVGQALARRLEWAHLDTDRVIEADLGRPLQEIFDGLGREAFIQVEERIVAALRLKRCVISTGGSVVYGPAAMARLHELGPVVHLHAGLEIVMRRVGAGQGRGLAIGPGQTVADLYHERQALYEAAADLTVDSGALAPEDCARAIAAWLRNRGTLT